MSHVFMLIMFGWFCKTSSNALKTSWYFTSSLYFLKLPVTAWWRSAVMGSVFSMSKLRSSWKCTKMSNSDLFYVFFWTIQDDCSPGPGREDPFYESQENKSLIGVANIFLESLFYDVKLEYHVPIISQQGEVCHKLFKISCTSFFLKGKKVSKI
jgi:Kinesin protein 1B